MDLKYKRTGEYLIPDFELPEQPKEEITYYGEKRLDYLKRSDPVALTKMNLSMSTITHLIEVQKRAEELEKKLIKEMKEKEGIREELKNEDPVAWAGQMNNLKNRVREIVLAEVVNVK